MFEIEHDDRLTMACRLAKQNFEPTGGDWPPSSASCFDVTSLFYLL
jgi:hypothetical protein